MTIHVAPSIITHRSTGRAGHSRNRPSASLHEPLGLATVDAPGGIALKFNERRETSMPGVYAAGDLATPGMPSVTQASSQGAMGGTETGTFARRT